MGDGVMVTEEQAREKWCPMAMIAVTELSGERIHGSTNRVLLITDDDSPFREGKPPCLASNCMMWRWEISLSEARPTERGYCGLAGKPGGM